MTLLSIAGNAGTGHYPDDINSIDDIVKLPLPPNTTFATIILRALCRSHESDSPYSRIFRNNGETYRGGVYT